MNDLDKNTVVAVDNSLLLSCKSAPQKYQMIPDQTASNKKANNLNKLGKYLVSDIREGASKRNLFQKTCDILENDFVGCVKEAGSKNVITQVRKTVASKQKSEETQKEIETWNETIER